jgi:hypothetical protein
MYFYVFPPFPLGAGSLSSYFFVGSFSVSVFSGIFFSSTMGVYWVLVGYFGF